MTTAAPAAAKSHSYVYDPNDPCPTKGGPELLLPAGPYDQRAIGDRADVLKFVTAPLESPLEIAGAVDDAR